MSTVLTVNGDKSIDRATLPEPPPGMRYVFARGSNQTRVLKGPDGQARISQKKKRQKGKKPAVSMPTDEYGNTIKFASIVEADGRTVAPGNEAHVLANKVWQPGNAKLNESHFADVLEFALWDVSYCESQLAKARKRVETIRASGSTPEERAAAKGQVRKIDAVQSTVSDILAQEEGPRKDLAIAQLREILASLMVS